jgi:hypothetical protein
MEWKIFGGCEHCGHLHTGTISDEGKQPGVFPDIECPNCHQQTDNFCTEEEFDDVAESDPEEYGTKDAYIKVDDYKYL